MPASPRKSPEHLADANQFGLSLFANLQPRLSIPPDFRNHATQSRQEARRTLWIESGMTWSKRKDCGSISRAVSIIRQKDLAHSMPSAGRPPSMIGHDYRETTVDQSFRGLVSQKNIIQSTNTT
jgi:hypothetical protein